MVLPHPLQQRPSPKNKWGPKETLLSCAASFGLKSIGPHLSKEHMDSIDITNLVGSLQETFVTWAVDYVFAEMIVVPGLQWLALPIISTVVRVIIKWIANTMSSSLILQAFFLNTSIRKASQAADYIDAVNLKQNLSPGVSDEEYEKAERAEIAAFNNFVRLSN